MNRIGRILDQVLGQRDHEGPGARKVIVGLGNPGERYARTRHNLGFLCIDRLADMWAIDVSRRRRLFVSGEGMAGATPVVLAKPRTYVNDSGRAVVSLFTRFRAAPADLIVVYDELDLAPGELRLRSKGSAGGHNGMRSIIAAIGTQDFARLRIGIGRPALGRDEVEHVLGPPAADERQKIDDAVDRAAQAVAAVIEDGIDTAMNRFN